MSDSQPKENVETVQTLDVFGRPCRVPAVKQKNHVGRPKGSGTKRPAATAVEDGGQASASGQPEKWAAVEAEAQAEPEQAAEVDEGEEEGIDEADGAAAIEAPIRCSGCSGRNMLRACVSV
jgi:uncharacterized membrane protein